MEKLILLCALLSAPSLAVAAGDPFQAGHTLYAGGKFAESAQQYETAAQAGQKHWVLEYNLGNAYYRQGQWGKAILHYERAFRMNSSQSDVIYNLGLATSKAGDPRLPSSALVLLAWRIFYFLSINTWTVLVSLLFLVLGVGFGFALAGRPLLRAELSALAGILFLMSAAWLAARIYVLEHPRGVVVSSVAEVRSGPSTTYPANFTVPEGHRVIILEEQEPIQGWRQIGVPREGLRGWVPESSVEII